MSRPRFSNLRESALSALIDTIHKEKNIPKDIVINIIEKAMQQAAKKAFGLHRDLEVTYNPNSKQEITIFEFKKVPIINCIFIKKTCSKFPVKNRPFD